MNETTIYYLSTILLAVSWVLILVLIGTDRESRKRFHCNALGLHHWEIDNDPDLPGRKCTKCGQRQVKLSNGWDNRNE